MSPPTPNCPSQVARVAVNRHLVNAKKLQARVVGGFSVVPPVHTLAGFTFSECKCGFHPLNGEYAVASVTALSWTCHPFLPIEARTVTVIVKVVMPHLRTALITLWWCTQRTEGYAASRQ